MASWFLNLCCSSCNLLWKAAACCGSHRSIPRPERCWASSNFYVSSLEPIKRKWGYIYIYTATFTVIYIILSLLLYTSNKPGVTALWYSNLLVWIAVNYQACAWLIIDQTHLSLAGRKHPCVVTIRITCPLAPGWSDQGAKSPAPKRSGPHKWNEVFRLRGKARRNEGRRRRRFSFSVFPTDAEWSGNPAESSGILPDSQTLGTFSDSLQMRRLTSPFSDSSSESFLVECMKDVSLEWICCSCNEVLQIKVVRLCKLPIPSRAELQRQCSHPPSKVSPHLKSIRQSRKHDMQAWEASHPLW